MKFIFVVNPVAGTRDATEEITKAIEGESNCSIHVTERAGEATEYVRSVCSTLVEETVFVACGGDGTVNEVANGLIGCDGAIMAIYPCGSGNDFVKAFGGAEQFLDLKNNLSGTPIYVDAMKMNGKYCVNVCNFGFDAVVGKTANEVKLKGGKDPYGSGVRKAIFTAMKNKATVEADGATLNPKGKFLLCTVANGRYVGGQFLCAPKSEYDDGLLDVCLFDPIGLFKFLSILKPYTAGEHLDGGKKFEKITHYVRAKEIRIRAPKQIDFCLDGEMIVADDLQIEAVPKAFRLLLPQKA